MFTRPTTPELLEAVAGVLRDLRDQPESASGAPLEMALEVTGVIGRRAEEEPRSLVAGIQEIEALASRAVAAHADEPDLVEAIATYQQAWPAGVAAAEPLAQYEGAGALLCVVSDVSYRTADAELIDGVFDVHTRRFERLSRVIGDYEAAGRT